MSSRSKSSRANSERENWNYYHGSGNRRARRRAELRKCYESNGAQMSIVELVQRAAQQTRAGIPFDPCGIGRHLNSLHPDTFTFLLRWGTIYKRGRAWLAPPRLEPERGQCRTNAWRRMCAENYLARKKKNLSLALKRQLYAYVEGIAYGPLVYPMGHAWNAWGVHDRKTDDWTFYAINNRVFYLGIPLTHKEYEELSLTLWPYQRGQRRREIPRAFNLFGRKTFGKIKVRVKLVEILRRRKREGKKLPKRKSR